MSDQLETFSDVVAERDAMVGFFRYLDGEIPGVLEDLEAIRGEGATAGQYEALAARVLDWARDDEQQAMVEELRHTLEAEREWLRPLLANDIPDSLRRRYDAICATLAHTSAQAQERVQATQPCDQLRARLQVMEAECAAMRDALRYYAEEQEAFDSDGNEIVVYDCTPDVAKAALEKLPRLTEEGANE